MNVMEVETYVDMMKGRPFADVSRELLADGFSRGKAVKERASGGSKVRFSRGAHEDAVVVDVVHAWEVDHFGIGRPGKVTDGKLVYTGVKDELG